MPEARPPGTAIKLFPESTQGTGLLRLMLCVRINSMVFCLDLEYVERVLPLVLLQPVPQGPDCLAGLMNLHGRTIPVIDLGARLGLAATSAYTAETPLIICKYEEQQAGLIVSEVLDIEPVWREAVQMTDEFDQSEALFLASANTSHGLALLLDIRQTLEIDWAGHEPAPLLSFPEGVL